MGVEHLQFTDGDIWLVNPAQTAPVVSGIITASAVEGGAAVSLDPLALASDADPGSILSALVPALPTGVTFDGLSLTLDPTNTAYDALGAGMTQIVTVDCQVSDGLHLTAAQAAFTVTGVNDAASFSGTIFALTEEGGMARGLVVVNDVDIGEATLVTDGIFASAHGVFAVSATGWNFQLDAEALDIHALWPGQTLVESLAIRSANGTVGAIGVTVTGFADSLAFGGDLADTLNGSAEADRLFGLAGPDVLNGKTGADTLDGGARTDRLSCGGGVDRVIWDGADLLSDGGAGTDTLVLNSSVTVNLGAADQVAGDTGVTRAFESVDAGLCLAVVSLSGSDGANRLMGGYGADTLAGGRGSDVLTGGMGADTFLFAARSGLDHVTDFVPGVDHLGVTGGTEAQISWTEIGADTRINLGITVVMLDGVVGIDLSNLLFL